MKGKKKNERNLNIFFIITLIQSHYLPPNCDDGPPALREIREKQKKRNSGLHRQTVLRKPVRFI